MVVCKFFLQGRCKYGENCKYEHQVNDNTQNHSASIMRQTSMSGNIDANVLVRSVQNDMLTAEKGGQWLLSSYAPFKDKPVFPGFEDKSFEEVRLGFYEASKSGNVGHYIQQLQLHIKDAVAKTKALQNPSPEAVHLLTQIYNTSPDKRNVSNAHNSIYSSTNFNLAPANKNIFNQSNQPVFGSNVFAGNSQNSIFTEPVQLNPNANIFVSGGGAPQSIFAAGLQSFKQQKNSTYEGFGPQQNSFADQRSNFPFSDNTSPFSTQNNTSVFAVQKHSNSPFAGQSSVGFNQPSPFITQQQSNPSFSGQQTAANPVLQQAPANTIFSPQTSNTFEFKLPSQQDQTSMFSVTQQVPHNMNGSPNQKSTTTNIFGGNNAVPSSIVNIDESVYSKIEDLSESDVKAFQSYQFEFGKIPEKPPTLQMCF